MSSIRAFLDIYIGHREAHTKEQSEYEATCAVLEKNASIYGMPTKPEELSNEQQDILKDVERSVNMRFQTPKPLFVGRLAIELDNSEGLSKTRANFIALCTGSKGMSKNAPTKKLCYEGVGMHRIVKDFVAQGGDFTRGDGSGGESIYGAKFADEKAGLKVKACRGSVAMANSGKNSNSSQFFIVLTSDEKQLAKLSGKYVVFGQVKDGENILEALNAVGSETGEPSLPTWVGLCGLES